MLTFFASMHGKIQANTRILQGPFSLVQLVFWLEADYLKGSDLVWTRKSIEAVPLDAAIRGIQPPVTIVSYSLRSHNFHVKCMSVVSYIALFHAT